MTYFNIFLRGSALASAVFLAGCAPQDAGRVSTKSDPYAVQATAPGKAQCIATSTSEIAQSVKVSNSLRSRSGLPPMRPNAALSRVAASHACDMAERGRMTHIGSKTSGPSARAKAMGYKPRIIAENIAAGPFDLNRVLREWNASPGHASNIMIPKMQEFGIGRAMGPDGRTMFWTAVYAAPL